MSHEFRLLIDGVERAGSATHSSNVIDPASGEAIGTVAYATAGDLAQAVSASVRGLRTWSATSPWERGRVLKRAADILRADIEVAARTITREQGKPLAQARLEVQRSADFLEWG